MTIFTLGHSDSYNRYLADSDNPCLKRGRGDGYPGGAVWKTVEEARQCCPDGYEVFGVDAQWGRDTAPNPDGYHDLLKDARFFRIP